MTTKNIRSIGLGYGLAPKYISKLIGKKSKRVIHRGGTCDIGNVGGTKRMKILCLYKNDCAKELFRWLEENGHTVVLWKEKLEEVWSILDGTPRGVTLHYMEPELDKGAILAQKIVCDGEKETLRSSYDNLDRAAKELFKETFKFYRYWPEMKKKPITKGNYHSIRDGKVIYSVIDTYDLSVFELKKRLDELCEGVLC